MFLDLKLYQKIKMFKIVCFLNKQTQIKGIKLSIQKQIQAYIGSQCLIQKGQENKIEKEKFLQQTVLKKLSIHLQKTNHSHTIHKINSKQNKGSEVRHKSYNTYMKAEANITR